MKKHLTIQIVGWNSEEHLKDACKGLQDVPQDEVAIRYIDNNSSDKSAALVRKLLPHADIIKLQKNLGFTGAHNIGFAACDTEFILVHDPDVRIEWKSIQALLKEFADPSVAAVQGKLLRKHEEGIIDSAGITQTLTLNGKERGAGEEDTGQYETTTSLLATTGACSLYRMDALKKVAHSSYTIAKHDALEVFDKEFFAYKEDVDLGWRLNKSGFTVLYVPKAMGTHARTLGHRGKVRWYFKPFSIYTRLKSPRMRYSIRNYIWMLIKNMTWKDEIKYDWFIVPRIFVLFIGSLLYPPLFSVWGEIFSKALSVKRKGRHA